MSCRTSSPTRISQPFMEGVVTHGTYGSVSQVQQASWNDRPKELPEALSQEAPGQPAAAAMQPNGASQVFAVAAQAVAAAPHMDAMLVHAGRQGASMLGSRSGSAPILPRWRERIGVTPNLQVPQLGAAATGRPSSPLVQRRRSLSPKRAGLATSMTSNAAAAPVAVAVPNDTTRPASPVQRRRSLSPSRSGPNMVVVSGGAAPMATPVPNDACASPFIGHVPVINAAAPASTVAPNSILTSPSAVALPTVLPNGISTSPSTGILQAAAPTGALVNNGIQQAVPHGISSTPCAVHRSISNSASQKGLLASSGIRGTPPAAYRSASNSSSQKGAVVLLTPRTTVHRSTSNAFLNRGQPMPVKPAADSCDFATYAESKMHVSTTTLRREASPPRITVRVTRPLEKPSNEASEPLGSLAKRFMVDPSAVTWDDVKARILQESATKV